MINYNYANFDNSFEQKMNNQDRDARIPQTQLNLQILNDREMFNKFSNTNDQIDMSSFNLSDSYGMPIVGGSTSNNKKSLLSTPFLSETNDKSNWTSSSTTWNQNDMYAELELDLDKNKDKGIKNANKSESRLDMMYNNNISGVDENENNGLCKIEADVLNFEYEMSKQKNKDIVVDVSSPFALAYIWKSLILLTKNPSTDKFVKTLGIKNKEVVTTDLKKYSVVFEDCGQLNIVLPQNCQTVNTNFINKMNEIYKINIGMNENSYDNIVRIEMNYNFTLEIPFYYQPVVQPGYMVGYNKIKTKFLELTDVPVFLMVDKNNNLVCLEIPCGSNMTLGFIYSTSQELLQTIPYDLIIANKNSDHLIKKLIIPKLNRNKKSSYSKNFKDILSQVHLGEIVYGNLYQIEIITNIGLNIKTSKEIPKDKYEIKKTFDNIAINHKCFYYVKNKFIQNKILSSGMINYS